MSYNLSQNENVYVYLKKGHHFSLTHDLLEWRLGKVLYSPAIRVTSSVTGKG